MNQPEIKLTGDERAAIRDLVLSETWKLLCAKVWGPRLDFFREACCSPRPDIDFAQGLYNGFKLAAEFVEHFSLPGEDVKPYQAASEADLVARRNRAY